MRSKMEEEVHDDRKKLEEQMQSMQEANQNLEGKLKEEAEKQARLRRQQWWMTALQLRVKTIVMKQVEKEQQEAAKLRQDLEKQQQEQLLLNE